MLVKGNIKDRVYQELIEYAFKKCDSVMFISRKDGFDDNQQLELDRNMSLIYKKLHNSLLSKRNGSYWVFTKVGYSQLGIVGYNDPPNFDKLFEIFFYKFNEPVKEYLMSNKDLYKWLNPEYPEDISFFKDGYCWLYSVAHEEICYIYCENNEEYEYLKSIGIKFNESEFIEVSKDELYYEDYINNKD